MFNDVEALGLAKAYFFLGSSMVLTPWALQIHIVIFEFLIMILKPWTLQNHMFPKAFVDTWYANLMKGGTFLTPSYSCHGLKIED